MLAWLVVACASPAPPPPPAPAPAAPPPVPRAAPAAVPVYALGDLHGDLDNAIATLRIAGLVDEKGHWTGGTAILVQTGDVVDRGPDSKALLAWLRALTGEASAAGGQVVALLGNHEVMNLRGDWRYVAPEDLAAYGGEDARRAAFAKDGADGAWLRTLPAVAQVGDSVFLHGGLRPGWARGGLDALNARIRAAIDDPMEDAALGEAGPLWYRGYVNDPEDTACAELRQALDALGARRMVVGHTTRRDGKVEARCGGALLVEDIGISDGYGSHLGLVEIRPGSDAVADYPTGPADLPDPR
jgi:hypothetical protein